MADSQVLTKPKRQQNTATNRLDLYFPCINNLLRIIFVQVAIWRRSFDVPPPPMEPDHPYYDTIVKDPRYAEGPSPNEFPKFESLKLTIERTLPFWNGTIVPEIKAGKQILIAAHGNSLRGIVKHLDSKQYIFSKLNIIK